MHSVRQACRPKHQVLVLKCYPRFQKGVQVVRPNSSELSYLLHYASTRRSKLLKVGAFLEKRAARDVWRQKLGNVQVTMQLLAALIEKLPRDLPLYASSVLAILDTVLQHSNDIAMVEETIPTFQVFCSHQDATALSADIDYINQYRDVVRKYASFTTTTTTTTSTSSTTTATDLRWRNVGLQAIRAVVGSEALGADWSRQLNIVLPVILHSLYHSGDPGLLQLQQRAICSENLEKEHARRRRMSIATVQTVDTVEAGDPESASGTAADADKAAEVEAQVLAFRCLEKVFTPGSNRLQIRLATALVLEFIVSRNPPRPKNDTSWATDLLEVIVNWAPVQDRFVVLVTLVEALAERPLVDGQLEPQLGLVYMIEWLLSSSINLIGLSVLDILIALLRFIVLLLHLGEGRVKVVPPPSKTAFAQPLALAHTHDTALPTAANAEEGRGGGGTATATNSRPSSGSMRQELLVLLQSSVANLANHVYYTDQVSDMVKTIVSRIRPASAQTSSTNNSDHESERAADESSSVVSDTYFSTPNARIIALKAVKDTLDVANRPGTGSSSSRAGGGTHARHPVPVHAWEGTQWLLRDADREVKYAYVDALLCWLKLETNDSDLRAPAEPLKVGKRKDRADLSDGAEKLVRKALPASGPDENKVAAAEVSRFLQHLHFNIYEIATDPAVSEADILLSHLLLVNLVERLGVNAIRYGLPVIMKLQSYCLDPSTPASPLKAGSLVHGYLSAVVERFTLEGTKLGRDILNEVVRRKKNGLWLSKVQLPPLPAARIMAEQPLNPSDTNTDPAAQSNKAAYTPFTSIVELVSQIETAYNQSCLSPTSSPASSPGAAAQGLAATLSFQPPARQLPTTTLLPSYIKEQMLSSWSREACLASIEQERTRSSSITGSKSGSVPARNHLNVNATASKNGTASSPTGTDSSHGHGQKWQRPVSASAAAAAATTATAPGTRAESRKDRRQSLTEIPHPRSPTTASSSKDSTVRVNELRRVLSVMNTSNVRHPSPLRGHSRLCSDDASSAESMVTDTFSTSDAGFSCTGPAGNADAVLEKVQQTHAPQPDKDKDNKSTHPVPPLPHAPQSRKQPSRSSSACQSRSNSRSRPLSKTRTPSTSRRAASPQTSTRSRKHSRSAADNPVEAWDPRLTQNPILLRSVSQSRRAEVDKLLGGIATPTPTTPDADTVVPLAPHDGAKGLLAPSRSISGRRGIGPPPY
ncbi:Plasma membrane localization protein [Trichophyton interdigitale]|nr:Plasma membrane localization protein [Trichophyton interdigitale]KAG5218349.1 Plasma membrane localization protein [Trichophyton interdigitale]KAG8206233.1 Plasma membrane localization protein [Trichophyton interdigitale]